MSRVLLRLLFGVLLSACARLPTDLPPRPTLRTPATAVTLSKLAGEAGDTTARPAWATFAVPELDRLIASALKDNPDLVGAQARLARADQAERLARLQTQPAYSSDVGTVREHLSKNGLFPPPMGGSTLTQTDATQNISYRLDWWDKNRALTRAAGDEARAAQAEAAQVRLTLTAAVADAYFSWGGVQARLGLTRELAARHRGEFKLLKARFDLGLDDTRPLLEMQRKLDLDEDRVRALEYLDLSGRLRLSALIGSDPDHAGTLPQPRLDASLAEFPLKLPLDWLGGRPDVAALRARVEAAADLASAARADFYPNVDLKLMVGLETLDLSRLLQAGSFTSSLGPAVHLPLFNTATLTVGLRQRESEYAIAVATYNRAVLEAAREVAEAYALLGKLARRAQAQARATQDARHSQAWAQRRHELGLVTPMEALEADTVVLERQMSETEIQTDRLRAQVSLYQALGIPFKE